VRAEAGFGIAGALLLAWTGFGWLEASAFRQAGQRAAATWPREPQAAAADVAPIENEKLARGAAIGVLEIPRLRFSEAVAEGDDDRTLKTAIGHLPDTPLPWTSGNSVFAGHRDTHFRALRNVRIGDQFRLRTPRGVFEYLVADKLIVSPEDVSVLAGGSERRLTLVTCYPFSYIGKAPQRFIVIADSTHTGTPGTARTTGSR